MRKPIIGLTPTQEEDKVCMRVNYFTSIWQSGGIPTPLPLSQDAAVIESYCRGSDALLFTGGVDVDPRYYGETVASPTVHVSPLRDSFELALLAAFLKTGKPIFGICRGMQVMNVGLGGSLRQDVANHRQTEPGTRGHHLVRTSPGSRLCTLCGSTFATNSFHHQAVKVPAPGVRITAHSDDGTAEALEMPDHPFCMAVQWHPEISFAVDSLSARLFTAFLLAASQNIK